MITQSSGQCGADQVNSLASTIQIFPSSWAADSGLCTTLFLVLIVPLKRLLSPAVDHFFPLCSIPVMTASPLCYSSEHILTCFSQNRLICTNVQVLLTSLILTGKSHRPTCPRKSQGAVFSAAKGAQQKAEVGCEDLHSKIRTKYLRLGSIYAVIQGQKVIFNGELHVGDCNTGRSNVLLIQLVSRDTCSYCSYT